MDQTGAGVRQRCGGLLLVWSIGTQRRKVEGELGEQGVGAGSGGGLVGVQESGLIVQLRLYAGRWGQVMGQGGVGHGLQWMLEDGGSGP